jgi:hypothetical protein
MPIIYPPLVEEAYQYQKQMNPEISKAEIYQYMYQKGLIDQTGQPTQEALQAGYIKEYTETLDLDYSEFLAIYPVFVQFPSTHFKRIDHFWQIDQELQAEILIGIRENQFTEDELIDLSAYFDDRSMSGEN